MRSNFEKALEITLGFEGGYSNHPDDPGGATMKGVTQRVYDKYRAQRGSVQQDVRYISQNELREIYKVQYWDLIAGDMLPSGIDAAVFDYAVNSGATRASRALQSVLGVRTDGNIGLSTVSAAKAMNAEEVIEKLCDERMAFVRRLKTFSTFGKGWTRRINSIRVAAVAMTHDDHAYFQGMGSMELYGGSGDDELAAAPADPRSVSLMSTNTGRGVATSSLGIMGTTVSEAADKIQSVAPYSTVIMSVSVLLLLTGVGLSMYGLYKAVNEERAA